ncbi:MAG: TOBE domain-containing protein, partial [Deltaproteobacteria bacterium]|nr:TOBE domain-containing protein [Deltaproteobacteria bacterium]
VQDTAQVLGIEDLLDRRPRQLSGGRRQRVALGRAMVRRPSAFLFDEPLSNLDAKLRGTMRADLARLHARVEATSIYVTHDQLEAMTLADQIVVMKDGRIQQAGSPLDVYDRPANAFVAEFMGAPTMNLFDATVAIADGRASIRAGGVRVDLPAADGLAAGPVRLGIRPQDLHVGPNGSIPMTVEVVETLGSECLVHGRSGDVSLVARTPVAERPAPGDRIDLAVDPSRVHLFDSATSQRIAIAQEQS